MSVGERFSHMRNELKELQTKEIQLEMELKQHESVLETIEKLNDDRKCFRLVGEVLVQSTVGETKPELKQQIENLKDVVEKMKQQVELKDKEIQQFQIDNKIQFKSVNEIEQMAQKK